MVHREFNPALVRAGMRKIRFHDLRHTYTSLLIAQDENIKFIQSQLGHASITTTMDRYGHLMPNAHEGVGEPLGFSNLVRQNRIEDVVPFYEDVLNSMTVKADQKIKQGIRYAWFSDTFIIYSRHSSEQDFAFTEHVARLFFQNLILSKIPVRGSLTVGSLYVNMKKRIFLGEALVDAYEYGERQDWLGFILTPQAREHLENTNTRLNSRAFYRLVTIKEVFPPECNSEEIYAFAFNNGRLGGGRNPYLDAVRAMKHEVDPKYVQKYINTEKFIQLHTAQSQQI